ncbi:hypothetical protein LZ496_11970 [Sphingomonas sp. NSE70-1]|uniref:DUF6894 domain-containing protein n=1 Tax=Sphingomonas caseinilyticus TaxID=2908205 RepID=A0ABT0RWW6_9SPHN|nr:hypothetical protein [Sphingomonas caseinilyticus]MCL6699497.1 hypothetical protein [Sphingomonas caseinilyticus]
MTVELDEVDYYRRREQDQRQLADQTSSQSIRNLHLDMADRYREMAQEAQLKQTGQDQDRPPPDDAAVSPRTLYYFHLCDGSDRLLDIEGQELPDLNAAKEFALHCARDTLSHEMKDGLLNLRLRLDVANAAGAVVHTLPLEEAFKVIKR